MSAGRGGVGFGCRYVGWRGMLLWVWWGGGGHLWGVSGEVRVGWAGVWVHEVPRVRVPRGVGGGGGGEGEGGGEGGVLMLGGGDGGVRVLSMGGGLVACY